MGTFVQVVAIGIAGAATLGFAFWGILVLLQPSLDRLRIIVHGKAVAVIPAAAPIPVIVRMPTQCSATLIGEPRLIPPREPSVIRARRMSKSIGFSGVIRAQRMSNSIDVGTVRANAPHPVLGVVDLNVLSSDLASRLPVRAGITVIGYMASPPDLLLAQQIFLEHAGAPDLIVPDPSGRFMLLNHGISLRMKAESEQAGFRLMETPQDLPALLGAPDDASMSKLRMAKFSRPPAVSS